MDSKAALLRFQVPTRSKWFTIGYGKEKVTVYSQQVRALNLAWALRRSKSHRDGPFVVVGGGAAGLTVAAGLAQSGAKVTVLEKEAVVLPLQYHCYKRHLHPHVFDWPDEEAYNPFADLPLLNWKAGTAREVALSIEAAFDELRHQYWPKLELQTGVRDIELDLPAAGELTYRVGAEPRRCEYDTLILALGFGVEDTFWAGARGSYWADDCLDQHGVLQGRYLVSGAGDGGLIDVLRILLRDMRQQDLARKVSAIPTFAELTRSLDDIENRWKSGGASVERDIYAAYEDLGASGILAPLDEILDGQINRDVHVTLATRSTPFSRKSRPLHRLLLSRLHFTHRDLLRIRKLDITEENLARDRSKARLHGEIFDHVVIRHGSKEDPMVHFPEVNEALRNNVPPPGVDEPQYEYEDFECHNRKGAVIEWSGGPDIEDYLDMLDRKVKHIISVGGTPVRTASLQKLHCEVRETPTLPNDSLLPADDGDATVDEQERNRRILEVGREQNEKRIKQEFDQVRKDRSWLRIPGLAVPMGDFDMHRATIVVGRVGAGKTTYLKVAADEALTNYRHDRKRPLPIWIDGSIYDFSEEKVFEEDVWARSLADAAVRSMELPTYSGAASTIRSKIRRGEVVLLLDGVDTWSAEVLRLTLKWITTRCIGTLIATRRLPDDVDASSLAGTSVVELIGLSADSALPFAKTNTDQDHALNDVAALVRDPKWELNPFLLGAAIHLSSSGSQNLARFGMLYLYEQLIDRALLRDEKRTKIRDALQRRARHDLRKSPPDVRFSRESLPLELRQPILRTHLVSGHRSIEFSHLSLGEYLASAPPVDLAAERERMLKDEPGSSWRHDLEVLPMAHARDADALDGAWSMVDLDDPEHFVLCLLLRAIAYGGDAVEKFCEQRATDIVAEVVKRISQPSARFSEAEVRLTRDLHRAKRFLHGAEVDSSTLPEFGRPGGEGWSLATAFGALENTPHFDSNLWSTAFHQAEQLLSRSPEEVWRDTRGGDMLGRQRACVLFRDMRRLRDLLASRLSPPQERAISKGVGSTLFSGLLSSPNAEARARAIWAQDDGFWSEPAKQDVLQWIFEHDPSPHVQCEALKWLEPGRSLGHCRKQLTRLLVERKRVTHSEQRMLSLLLRRLRDDEWVAALTDEFLASGKGWYLEHELIRELCEGNNHRIAILEQRIRSPHPSLSEITAAAGLTILEPALRAVLTRFLEDPTLVQQASVAMRSLPLNDGPSRSDRLKILQRPKPWGSETTILLADAIKSFKGDDEAISEVSPFLKQLENSSLASDAIETIGGRPEFWPLVFRQLREGRNNARLKAAKLLAKISDVRDELWAYFHELPETDDPASLDSHIRAIILKARACDGNESLLYDYIEDLAAPVRHVALSALSGNVAAQQRLRVRVLKEQDYNLQTILWTKFIDLPEVQERLEINAREDRWAVRCAYFALSLRDESRRIQLVEFVESLIEEGRSEWDPMLPEIVEGMASDSSMVRHLRELFFKHRDLRVRGTVLQALRRDSGLRERIRDKLDEPDWSNMFDFGLTPGLERYFQDDTESLERIVKRLRDCPDVANVPWVLPVLHGYAPARDLLRSYKEYDEINTRRAALEALRDQPEERQELIDMLGSEDRSTKKWAAEVLEDVTDNEVQRALAERLDDELPELRQRALKAHRRLRRAIPGFNARWRVEDDEKTRCLLMEAHLSCAEIEVVADDFRSIMGSETSERGRSIACSVLRRAEPVKHSLRAYLGKSMAPDNGRLEEYLRSPCVLDQTENPEGLWEHIERWLLAKLVSTLPVDMGNEDVEVHIDGPAKIFGEIIDGPLGARLRLAMDSAVLPRDRNIWPAANVVHAWRIASYMRSEGPRTFLLACADLASEELRFPDLSPGELCLGPVYFGFRLRETSGV